MDSFDESILQKLGNPNKEQKAYLWSSKNAEKITKKSQNIRRTGLWFPFDQIRSVDDGPLFISTYCRRILLVQTVTKTKECTDELVVKVLLCTWALPVDLITDMKVEMDAQIFYVTNGSSLIKKQVRSKIWCGCDENKWRNPKIHKSR